LHEILPKQKKTKSRSGQLAVRTHKHRFQNHWHNSIQNRNIQKKKLYKKKILHLTQTVRARNCTPPCTLHKQSKPKKINYMHNNEIRYLATTEKIKLFNQCNKVSSKQKKLFFNNNHTLVTITKKIIFINMIDHKITAWLMIIFTNIFFSSFQSIFFFPFFSTRKKNNPVGRQM
jgi:hypothetical protein